MSWSPGGSGWQQMTYTGYIIRWRKESSSTWMHNATFGNITTTTIGGLEPDSSYVFSIAGLNENQNDSKWWDISDLYGRRNAIEGFIQGSFVEVTGHTLAYDFNFHRFDANSTLDHGPHAIPSSIGPTGCETG
eukprot:533220_1